MVEASRDELSMLAEQQAALRRVATLVARGSPPPAVFAAVAGELGRCRGVPHAALFRYQPDGLAPVLAARAQPGLMKMAASHDPARTPVTDGHPKHSQIAAAPTGQHNQTDPHQSWPSQLLRSARVWF
jgi:GAF domain-containing protein